jgi:anti-sigma factor (TIGR02949 family)
MANCREIESSLTAYADGECPAAECSAVEAHLERCPSCRARVSSERATHEILRSRCGDLRGCAPEGLRQRCAAQRRLAARRSLLTSRPWVSFSVAATLVVAVGLFVLFGVGTPVETYAAQLAADHIKCFQFPPSTLIGGVEGLGREWQTANGWPLRIAGPSETQTLQLVGLRRCGSSRGRVAHIMYRWRGQPLSVFILNDELERTASRQPHAHHAIEKLGEQEVIWSERGRTYAVVARASADDLERMAHYLRPNLE